MGACVVDFFDNTIAHKYYTLVDETQIVIDNDYLSPNEMSIELIKTDKIQAGYVFVLSTKKGFLGLVTKVDQQDYSTLISFKPWLAIFDHDVRVNTGLNKGTNKISLEHQIAELIKEYWQGSDEKQNFPMTITENSSTKDWALNLEPTDKEKNDYGICNLYDIIQRSLAKYGIAVNYSLDITKKVISLKIQNETNTIIIDADNRNVQVGTFTIEEASTETNKLEIWNGENFTTKVTYYLHLDKKWDTSATDRPPGLANVAVYSVEPEYETKTDANGKETKTVTKTFEEAAKEQADQFFYGVGFRSEIELTVLPNDTLIKPTSLRFGQVAKIIKDKTVYESILTGTKYNADGTMTLVFGSIRTSLIKKIKLGMKL